MPEGESIYNIFIRSLKSYRKAIRHIKLSEAKKDHLEAEKFRSDAVTHCLAAEKSIDTLSISSIKNLEIAIKILERLDEFEDISSFVVENQINEMIISLNKIDLPTSEFIEYCNKIQKLAQKLKLDVYERLLLSIEDKIFQEPSMPDNIALMSLYYHILRKITEMTDVPFKKITELFLEKRDSELIDLCWKNLPLTPDMSIAKGLFCATINLSEPSYEFDENEFYKVLKRFEKKWWKPSILKPCISAYSEIFNSITEVIAILFHMANSREKYAKVIKTVKRGIKNCESFDDAQELINHYLSCFPVKKNLRFFEGVWLLFNNRSIFQDALSQMLHLLCVEMDQNIEIISEKFFEILNNIAKNYDWCKSHEFRVCGAPLLTQMLIPPLELVEIDSLDKKRQAVLAFCMNRIRSSLASDKAEKHLEAFINLETLFRRFHLSRHYFEFLEGIFLAILSGDCQGMFLSAVMLFESLIKIFTSDFGEREELFKIINKFIKEYSNEEKNSMEIPALNDESSDHKLLFKFLPGEQLRSSLHTIRKDRNNFVHGSTIYTDYLLEARARFALDKLICLSTYVFLVRNLANLSQDFQEFFKKRLQQFKTLLKRDQRVSQLEFQFMDDRCDGTLAKFVSNNCILELILNREPYPILQDIKLFPKS